MLDVGCWKLDALNHSVHRGIHGVPGDLKLILITCHSDPPKAEKESLKAYPKDTFSLRFPSLPYFLFHWL